MNAKESKRGQTALMWAAAEGNVEAVQALIKAGADFHARLDSGFTPFLFAVREGRLDAVKALLKAGADVNETIASPRRITGGKGPRAGTTALHSRRQQRPLRAGRMPAGRRGRSERHRTRLYRAPYGHLGSQARRRRQRSGAGRLGQHDQPAVREKARRQGADVNARMTKKVNVGLTSLNTLGATPFLLAARTADAELMRYLATLGADPKIPNADGRERAHRRGRSRHAVARRGRRARKAKWSKLYRLRSISAATSMPWTTTARRAMHGAAYKNFPGAVDFLAAHGAKIEVWNQKNKQGWTPLTIAEGYRFGNFKPSPETAAAIRRAMVAAGVTPPDPLPPLSAPTTSGR